MMVGFFCVWYFRKRDEWREQLFRGIDFTNKGTKLVGGVIEQSMTA
jgi:hypothetical protein